MAGTFGGTALVGASVDASLFLSGNPSRPRGFDYRERRDGWKLASRFLSAVLFPSLVIAPAIAAGPFTVVADGLQNPRGLAFGPGGRLYVAQAGSGGATATGKITEIRYPWLANPAVHDVVTGLISVGKESTAVSVAGLSAIGNGTLYAAMEVSNAATGFPSRLGHLLKVSQGGQIRDVSNVGDFDYAWTIVHHDLAPRDFPDSNPYGVLALSDQLYVANAASNTLDLVHPDGTEEILAYFPNNAIADATPTCIAQGPDGALYIGTPGAGGQHCLRPVSDCLSRRSEPSRS